MLDAAPIIFYKLAMAQAGDFDLKLTMGGPAPLYPGDYNKYDHNRDIEQERRDIINGVGGEMYINDLADMNGGGMLNTFNFGGGGMAPT